MKNNLSEVSVVVHPASGDGGCAYVESLEVIDPVFQNVCTVMYDPKTGPLIRGDNLVPKYDYYIRMRDN